LAKLEPGQFFGELSLLTGAPRTATIRAEEDSETLRLEKKDFKDILDRFPHLAEQMAQVVGSRQAALLELAQRKEVHAPAPKADDLSSKIREFFNLKGRS
jgi:CRP-like cAMP-binding protein